MTTSQPAISICIPAYNSQRYIIEVLHSVILQTFTDWEIIIVEDGSCDNTECLVTEFCQSIPQSVIYKRHECSKGPNAARNTGISVARAGWIALLDSDDIWLPNHLETCLETAIRTGAELIHSGSILFDSESGNDISVRAPTADAIDNLPLSLFNNTYIIQPSSVLLSSNLWEQAGYFDPHLRFSEDLDMWLRCARAGGSIAYTGLETCRYRKHAFSPSTNSAAMADGTARAFEKHLTWQALSPKFRQNVCANAWAVSARLHWRSEPLIAARQFRRACSLHWRPRWFFHWMLCICMSFLGIELKQQA